MLGKLIKVHVAKTEAMIKAFAEYQEATKDINKAISEYQEATKELGEFLKSKEV